MNLDRFVDAQQPVFDEVCRELRAGRKRTHWMWFVFPQIAGIAHSERSRYYAILSLDEARAFLAHPILGPRLRLCTQLVNAVEDKRVLEILGSPDDKKFHSCMTLFILAAPGDPLFRDAMAKYFGGVEDHLTVQIVQRI